MAVLRMLGAQTKLRWGLLQLSIFISDTNLNRPRIYATYLCLVNKLTQIKKFMGSFGRALLEGHGLKSHKTLC